MTTGTRYQTFTRRSGRVTLCFVQHVLDTECNLCLLEIVINYLLCTIVSIQLFIEALNEVHVFSSQHYKGTLNLISDLYFLAVL